jgi:hypothetical protein
MDCFASLAMTDSGDQLAAAEVGMSRSRFMTILLSAPR